MEMWEPVVRESVRQTLADYTAASSYFLALTNIGVDHWGRYRDVLVPVNGRWLFASREAVADGFSPESLMR
jgi:hypothetical protein